MKGLQGERLRQAFKHFDSNQDGFISPEQFKRIIVELAGHKLSDSVLERLPTLTTLTPGQNITFAQVVAFQNVIQQMDMVERVIRDATAKSKDGRIDQTDFLNHASKTTRYGLFSPMEASIIFHFASRGAGGHSRLALMDFAQVLDPRWKAPSDVDRERAIAQSKRSFLDGLLHSAYNFGLGGIAGSFGATVVYPIDLVKVFPIHLVKRSQR
ncbi:mitochondrial aspartate-glutamate transporter agc1 [Ceratobasidium sp. 394]|nr:mitochondrial aspartate-glutamate transporter agc1 [Ceratobasidium sp. 394]